MLRERRILSQNIIVFVHHFFSPAILIFLLSIFVVYSATRKKGSTLNMCDEDAGEACVELRWGKWRNGFVVPQLCLLYCGSESFMIENEGNF